MTSMTFPSHFQHHEDIVTGATHVFGRYEVTKEQIFAFARTYDPQPMHLDEVAARASIAGGLCASGFHTCAVLMRMMCDGVILTSASLGSPGVDEMRWLKPVRPGDVLSVRGTWGEKRVSASRPHVGISKSLFELLNADGDVVATLRSNQMLALRHPPTVGPPLLGPAAPPKTVQRIASLWDEPAASAPQPSRTFHPQNGYGMIHVPLPSEQIRVAGAAVSVEPEQGVAQPTGDIVLVGTFSQQAQ